MSRSSLFLAVLACIPALGAGLLAAGHPQTPAQSLAFLEKHCFECHDSDVQKGGLDLTALAFDLESPAAFREWVKIHDRVRDGEMPPKKQERPEVAQAEEFLKELAAPLQSADQAKIAREGRATWRRLNRHEYENALRDLFGAPWLQVKEMLPEDGEAHRFNKSGDALDISHVQMARYLNAADYVLREVAADAARRPETQTRRFYAREQKAFTGKLKFGQFNSRSERATFPLLGTEARPKVISGEEPMTVGAAHPEVREQEAMGVVASNYEPIEVKFNNFKAPVAGRYKLRFSAYSFWAGPGSGKQWWIPSRDYASAGRRNEPVSVHSEKPPRQLRKLGDFDVTPEPAVDEMEVWLLAGETVRVDAARLFRSRPPNWRNPLAEKDGMPGVAYRWMEAEGPLYDAWPTAGHKLLFGELPVEGASDGQGVQAIPKDAPADARQLLRAFLTRAYRRPIEEADVQRFSTLVETALKNGADFTEALFTGYTAVLCSPDFISLKEKPGPLDDAALASRLACFLTNSLPDEPLRALAEKGELRKPEVLQAEAERLLNDTKSRRFVEAFLGYWLDLRKVSDGSPDETLYPDYYLDDLLVESAAEETPLFFAELLRHDLPARHLVASDFVMVNERLAAHYGLPPVDGVALRRVALPPDSLRGGLMTQASVLKVTANGTTTSPVVRGAWIMERILGQPPPPPPPDIPAVEPDIRGAATIREQLEKHRTQESCNACHAKIDPAGFALEQFDVLGGWREKYRALGKEGAPEGFGKNGQAFEFHPAQLVDPSGVLPDGRAFQNIRDLKNLLLADERQIARNLVRQLILFSTGSAVRFSDRAEVERILDRAAARQFGVRSIIHEVIQSKLFQQK